MSKKSLARHGRAPSLAVSAWPLRRKVALALAIPLLLAATLGGLRVRSDLNEASNSSSSAKQVTVLRPAVAYLTAAERAMVAAQGTSDTSRADLKADLRDIGSAATRLEAVRDTADLTAEQRYQVDALLDLSRALRDQGADTLGSGTWAAELRQLQSGVTQLITTIVNAQINPEPRLELLAQTLGGRFSLSMQQALVATKRSGKTGSQELFAELGVEGAAIDRLASSLGDSGSAISTLRTQNAERTRTVRTGGTDLGGAGAYTQYDALITDLSNGIDKQLAASASSARTHALVNGGITLAALLAAVLLALLVSWLLLNPIRKVREGALTVAHEQLPEEVARIRAGEDPGRIVPIDVTTHEEIGQLARAVDDMHRQAVHLAAGEARVRSQVSEMFVTLSRRNTSLINKQLGLIETLEKDEEDPRRLESLFRLDHLAARMRRTADSLLILADAPPARVGGQNDLTVADALQAATSGVQDYQRVRVAPSGSTARISDTAAPDVVHLLTELVDNALSYSSPTSTVSLDSTVTADGVTIEVADAGLGIAQGALDELNETLRSGGDVTPDTARRMGLFVVSRLAQKHGITASLRRNDQNGITATVALPSSLLPDVVQPGEPAASWAEPLDPGRTALGGGRATVAVSEQVAPSPPATTGSGLPRRRPQTALDGARLPRRTPISPAVPTGFSAEQAPLGYYAAAESATESHSPIFESLRSAWLTSGGGDGRWRSSEIEAGWDRADRVAASPGQSPLGASGLPVRRPGARLVPGGVSKHAAVTARDPEAIRQRLAAHAAGVARGRSAALDPNPEDTEAGPA